MFYKSIPAKKLLQKLHLYISMNVINNENMIRISPTSSTVVEFYKQLDLNTVAFNQSLSLSNPESKILDSILTKIKINQRHYIKMDSTNGTLIQIETFLLNDVINYLPTVSNLLA